MNQSQFERHNLAYLFQGPPDVMDQLYEHGFFLGRSEIDEPQMIKHVARFLNDDLTDLARQSHIQAWDTAMMREASARQSAYPTICLPRLDAGSIGKLRSHFGRRLIEFSGESVGEALHNFRLCAWSFGIVYHVACMGSWKHIVEDQLKLLAECKLTGLHVTFLGNEQDLLDFDNIAKAHDVSYVIDYQSTDLEMYEIPGMRSVQNWSSANPEGYVLYFHTKGASRSHDEMKQCWRVLMEECVIRKWRENAERLRNGFDAVGTVWRDVKAPPHFAGNFYMATAKYVNSLPDFGDYYRDTQFTRNGDHYRIGAEMWIGSSPSKPAVSTYFGSEVFINRSEFWSLNRVRIEEITALRSLNLQPFMWKTMAEIVNELILTANYRSYVEISCGFSQIFDRVESYEKCMCQFSGGDYDFSRSMIGRLDKYDVVMVAGSQNEEDVFRDLNFALALVSERGVVLCRDIHPYSEEMQELPRPRKLKAWTGNGWKAWINLRRQNDELKMISVRDNFGIGIVLPKLCQLSDESIATPYQSSAIPQLETWADFQRFGTFSNFFIGVAEGRRIVLSELKNFVAVEI